jgi:hypothetical protein
LRALLKVGVQPLSSVSENEALIQHNPLTRVRGIGLATSSALGETNPRVEIVRIF